MIDNLIEMVGNAIPEKVLDVIHTAKTFRIDMDSIIFYKGNVIIGIASYTTLGGFVVLTGFGAGELIQWDGKTIRGLLIEDC